MTGKDIPNELTYGKIKGYKINRETGEAISGALFGLFRADKTRFTEDNALLTAESDADGVFTFEKGRLRQFCSARTVSCCGLSRERNGLSVAVDKDGDVVEITAVNDLIPENGTTATVDDEKEVCATEVFTLTDTVEYKHLVPGKEYTVKGILMDKSTCSPFLQNGEQITSEVTFVPEAPSGSVEVLFVFDAKLYQDGHERQPKPFPEQAEKEGKKGGSQPSQKQEAAETEPESVLQEVNSDGQN